MITPQYTATLDAAPILRSTPRAQLGPALAHTIKNTTWFNLEADRTFDSRRMSRLVRDLERSGPNRVESAWRAFVDYASRQNIWINEN